jgi:hypothetical protein
MADTKISALTAAAAAALANEFAINEAGTSKKLTLQQALDGVDLLADAGALADANKLLVTQSAVAKDVALSVLKTYTTDLVITGQTGAVDQASIGRVTHHILTSNPGDVTGVSLVTQMTAQTMGVGWWLAEYFVHWQSDVTTTGINMVVDHTGTATPFVAHRADSISSTTALATVGIAHQTAEEGVVGNLASHWAANADAGNLGPNAGVTTADSAEFSFVQALFLVTGSGNLTFRIAAEIAATAVRLQAGTYARYIRLS